MAVSYNKSVLKTSVLIDKKFWKYKKDEKLLLEMMFLNILYIGSSYFKNKYKISCKEI